MRGTSSRPSLEQPVRLALDPAGHVGVGRPAVRRVVLEAAVAGRVVRRRDDDPVRGGRLRPAPAAVVGEDRVRDRRRRRVAAVGVDDDLDAVAGEHLDDRAERRLGQRVRVAAEVERAARALLGRGSGTTAALIATTCASVNEPSSDVPRCPEVPNATGAAGGCSR